jgi:hypothetical protein
VLTRSVSGFAALEAQKDLTFLCTRMMALAELIVMDRASGVSSGTFMGQDYDDRCGTTVGPDHGSVRCANVRRCEGLRMPARHEACNAQVGRRCEGLRMPARHEACNAQVGRCCEGLRMPARHEACNALVGRRRQTSKEGTRGKVRRDGAVRSMAIWALRMGCRMGTDAAEHAHRGIGRHDRGVVVAAGGGRG